MRVDMNVKHKNTKQMNMNYEENNGDCQKTTKTKPTQLYCNECDYSCQNKKNLKKHKGQMHERINKNQNIACNSCGKKFHHMSELDIHFEEEHPNCKCTADSVCDECISEWIPKA